MERTFDLGMSAIPYRGKRRHLYLTVELGGQRHRKPDEGYFVTIGTIGGLNRWISCGQCLEKIRLLCRPKWKPLLDELSVINGKYWLRYCKRIPKKDAKRIREIILN